MILIYLSQFNDIWIIFLLNYKIIQKGIYHTHAYTYLNAMIYKIIFFIKIN